MRVDDPDVDGAAFTQSGKGSLIVNVLEIRGLFLRDEIGRVVNPPVWVTLRLQADIEHACKTRAHSGEADRRDECDDQEACENEWDARPHVADALLSGLSWGHRRPVTGPLPGRGQRAPFLYYIRLSGPPGYGKPVAGILWKA